MSLYFANVIKSASQRFYAVRLERHLRQRAKELEKEEQTQENYLKF